MRAEPRHIPTIAKDWYHLKAQTCFGGLDIEWSLPLCATHLQQVMDQSNNYIAVDINNGKVQAACGVTLINLLTPPHPLVVTEWMWIGQGKPAARVWAECRAWGKAQGAILAHCAVGKPSTNKKKFTEQYQWRVL